MEVWKMKRIRKKLLALVLVLSTVCSLTIPVAAASNWPSLGTKKYCEILLYRECNFHFLEEMKYYI
jgi:hypothetical protein